MSLHKIKKYIHGELFLILFYLAFWISPETILSFDEDAIVALRNFPIFEFLFSHSTTAFLALILVQKDALLKGGNKFLRLFLPWGLMYGVFFSIFLYYSEGRWVTLLYLYGVVERTWRGRDFKNAGPLLMHQIARFFFFMITVAVAELPIFPYLGAKPGMFPIEGNSFMAEPHRLFAWIICFFSCVYLYELKLAKKVESTEFFKGF